VTLLQHRRFRTRLIKRIADRSARSDCSDIANAQRDREIERYLSSHAVQSAVRFDIWNREFGRIEAEQRWASVQREPVCPFSYERYRSSRTPFFHKPRSTRGFRKICRLGELEKMWHVMARDLIVAQHRPRPHIGDWSARGRDKQIDQILACLRTSRQAVVCADITRAFPSVNFDAVYELPYLPEPLIRRAIDYRSQRFVRKEGGEYTRQLGLAALNGNADDLERSPSGLMEGSPASNAIFSVLMDDLPDHLDEGILAFIYCDNIVLIAPSMSRALRAQAALARYLSGHRAGPFEMRSTVSSASEPFEHLGYSLERRARSQPAVSLSLSGWLKLGARLETEEFDPDRTTQWLTASYGRCSPHKMEEYQAWIAQEVGFRAG